MKIQAAVLTAAKGKLHLKTVDLDDDVRPGEVLVKVVATGLCHSDLAVRDQQLSLPIPAILGHEGSGVVERVGSSVSKVKPGDHVVLAPASCGQCQFCKQGHPSYCTQFRMLNISGRRADESCPYHDHDGQDISGLFFYQSSFATYSLTSELNVIKVPKDVPLEILGPLGCGFQTGAGTVINVLKPKAGESIAVFGVGPVGMAAIMAAKASGCTTIIAVDVHDNRLALAIQLGATHVINSRNAEASALIQRDIHPGGVHCAVDTTGRNEVINQAVASLHFMGTCALLGISPSPKFEIDNATLSMGRSVIHVIEGDSSPDIFIPQLIGLYKNGLFPFDRLINFYELNEINQAIEDTENGVTLKAVIRMPD